MRIEPLRRTSQAAFLAITLVGIAGIATTGLIYPYFFCYSCPWDVGNCPLGIMEHGFVDIQITFWLGVSMLLYLFGFLSLMGLLLGRAFCGWACPMGLLQDIARKLGVSDRVRKKLRPNVNPKYKNVKYLILLAIPITAYLSKDLFYTNLCPVGGVTGTIPTLLFYSSEWVFGSTFPVKLTSIILFFLLIVLVTRGWCKYLCPVGAYLAPWNMIAPVRVKRDESSCANCGLCEIKCPMDVNDIGMKPDSECVLCGRCVTNCKFNSLKIGPMPFESRKLMAIWTVLLLVSVAMLAGGALTEGYARADKINSLPCLGCLALDPYQLSEWRTSGEAQPDFVALALPSKPVFLHYRTDVCPGCDEMEPHVAILEEQYGSRVEFIHINLDHATPEQDASYDVYDFAGTPTARFGVPMFSTVIVTMDGAQPQIQYNTQYGSSSDQGETKREELETTILDALDRHVTSGSPLPAPSDAMVLTELFVDQGCVNCYKSEDALVELEENGETDFVTYVTDAPGVSGDYAAYREKAYAAELGQTVLGHPWAVFAGGPGGVTGALSTASALADYRTEIGTVSLAPVNVSVTGSLADSQGTMFSNISITNPGASDEALTVEAFLVEKASRWLNLQGDPVPNAFVDLVVNGTYTVPAGGNTVIPVAWTGNDAVQFSDMRLGNTAIAVAVWKGDIQVTCKVIASNEPDALFLTAAKNSQAALPNGTADFGFNLYNYLGEAVGVNLSADVPLKWSAALSTQTVTIPAGGNASFMLRVTGSDTAPEDAIAEFRIEARGISDPTLQAFSRVSVEVKDDIAPPVVVTPVDSPDLPRADEAVTVRVVVGDNTVVSSVRLSYFSCTPETCSPYFIVDMNLTSAGGNEYAASVYPVGHDHTDLHYRIIATDAYGNTMTTGLYDVELEPVEHYADTTKPKWMGVIVLCVFALIAVAVALSSRERQPRYVKQVGEVPEEEEPGGKI